MDAIKSNINSILDGKKQFIIPVYQRTYSWEKVQCQRLWKDIVRMQKDKQAGHFVGSIVNIAEQMMPAGVQKFMIIDGQQRITTLILLLIALRDYLLAQPDCQEVNPDEITETCLKNKFQTGIEQYKLILTKTDKGLLLQLIEAAPIKENISSRILDNYYFFLDRIAKKELSPAEIYQATGKLQIVNITLDRQYDDPQLIFESLNSTGLDLSQSDLIRNYILMGLEQEEQNQIYNNIWYAMEVLFDYNKKTVLMDRFFRDYLTMKLGHIPNINKVYDEFKLFHQISNDTVNIICMELYQYAKYYTNLYYCKSEGRRWNHLFADIKALQMEVAYPFLLKVYDDFENQLINDEEFEQILRLCESYVFRRAICGIPTNSLNKTFAMMKNEIDENNYLISVKVFFITRESYKEFPTDERFSVAFCSKDIYNMRIRNYILSKLENAENKAPINIENYTIEHIMPQNSNLSIEWRQMLGNDWRNVQRNYLHTIGNLTLTAYNSEMSDHSFLEKMEMDGGFKQSALRINKSIINQLEWNEEAINTRALELYRIAIRVWQFPKLSAQELEFYLPKQKEEQYSIENYKINESVKLLLEHLDKRIMNISAYVKKELTKHWIAYKYETNFVDVVIRKNKCRLFINLKFSEVDDRFKICRDITNIGHWGNGDVEILFENLEQLDAIIEIVVQAYNKQLEEIER